MQLKYCFIVKITINELTKFLKKIKFEQFIKQVKLIIKA